MMPLQAGDFSRSFGRGDVVKFVTPKLPVFYTGAKRVAVLVDDAPPGFPVQQLSAAIEQRLSTDFSITPSSPDLTFRIRVFFEVPKAEISSRNETVKVQTGTRPAVDANGNPRTNAAGQQLAEPVYENKDLPVELWQGSGRLSLQVEVFGPEPRAIDGFSPSHSFSKRIVVAADGVAQVDRSQLPNETQITDALIQTVAEPFLARYCRQKETLEVRLAVDEELRQGNELAKVGQWPKAVELWLATEPKKFPGDRLHNIGTAYESTFYELYWRDEPAAKLELVLAQARKYHDDAIVRDPKEKQHRTAQDRLALAQSLVQRMKSTTPPPPPPTSTSIFQTQGATASPQQALQQATQQPAQQLAQQAPLANEFRQLVRMRIRNLTVTPDNERPNLEATAMQAFQLTKEEAQKLMDDEINPWLKIRENLLIYKATFDAFNADQKIARDERQILRGLSSRLKLNQEDLKLVEIPGQFTETP